MALANFFKKKNKGNLNPSNKEDSKPFSMNKNKSMKPSDEVMQKFVGKKKKGMK